MPSSIPNRIKRHRRLLEITPTDSPELEAAWRAAAEASLEDGSTPRPTVQAGPEQFLVLSTCRDEQQQVELLERFGREGLDWRALLS